ncbi:hypothetical protein PR202_ga14354 [Eleusine coracana subsp. coracana]|uniref:RNA pseudouridine synthase 2, chloroplastic n=1 Tax=Eleusine coracana subsp. coracana TaxID=191504 RepID=A0AAV5CHC7_ELECO|nr:hypothetical protein PR202_ga14354 [Eleusine coracana subsp. coracana]
MVTSSSAARCKLDWPVAQRSRRVNWSIQYTGGPFVNNVGPAQLLKRYPLLFHPLASPMAAATAPPPAAIATTLSSLLRRRSNHIHRIRATYPVCFSYGTTAEAAELESRRGGHGGTRLEEAVPAGEGRSRLDAWISARLGSGGVSRARVQASIRAGLVAVNGRPVSKVSSRFSLNLVSHMVKGGDLVTCTVSELQPLRAEAETSR